MLNACCTGETPLPSRCVPGLPGPARLLLVFVLGIYSHLQWLGSSCSNLFFKESEDESLFLLRVLACFLLKQMRRKAEGNGTRSQAVTGAGKGPSDPCERGLTCQPGEGRQYEVWNTL